MKKLLLLSILMYASLTRAQIIFSEDFDNISTLSSQGWELINTSEPMGAYSWFQGIPSFFSAYNGNTTSYIGVNYQSTGSLGTISNWLISPVINLKNGDIISFYSRDHHDDYADRLEFRLSLNGAASTLPSNSSSSVGDFTTLVLTINPNLLATGYPSEWTEYTYTVSGLSQPTDCRLAFRYYVTNGGSNGQNSDYIGIDALSVQTNPLAVTSFNENKLSIYPIPAINSISITNYSSQMKIEVIDMVGKNITLNKIDNNSFDVSQLQKGSYFVKVLDTQRNTCETLKFIKY